MVLFSSSEHGITLRQLDSVGIRHFGLQGEALLIGRGIPVLILSMYTWVGKQFIFVCTAEMLQ